MHELENNPAGEPMALPGWVTRPTALTHAVVASSFMIAWLLVDRFTVRVLSVEGVAAWSVPAGLGVALVWALGVRYAWVVVASAWLGLMMSHDSGVVGALLVGAVVGASYAGTGWLLSRVMPAGRLPTRPLGVAASISAMFGGAIVAAGLQAGVLRVLTGRGLGGDTVVGLAVGDALGVLVVSPLLVVVVGPWLCRVLCVDSDRTKARYTRAVGCEEFERRLGPWAVLGAVAVGLALLMAVSGLDPRVYYLGFIALPALAMRYRLAGGLGALGLSVGAGLVLAVGRSMDLAALADLQLILSALAVSTLLVGWFAVMRFSAEEQRQAEQRWAMLAIRGSGMGRWYWDLGTDRLVTDYVLTDAFGYRRDKVLPHRSWWEQRVHPEDVRRNRRELDRLLSGQVDYYEAENRMMAADGTWGWYHSQGTVIERDGGGRPKRIAGTHEDITERKELERIRADAEATHRSEQRFRTLADGAPVAIFQTDAKGVYLYVNPAWRQMTGMDQTEALYRGAAAFAHASDRNDVADHWAAAIRTATPVSIEHRVVTPNSQTLWLQTQATPMNHNGVLLGFVGTSVDVTPYRNAMAMIRDSEARYRTLADHAYDMLWRVSAQGLFTYVSPSITKLMGYSPEQMVGTDAFNYFHPDDLDRVRVKHAALTPDTPEFHDVHRYRRSDGSYIVFEAVGKLVVPEGGAGGEPEGASPYITGISRDVTQRVEGEQIRRELEEKLARSQKLDAIGTFATGIAHDFRNSLLAIKASAQSAGRKLDEDHPALPALSTVNDACTQAMAVTQSLLTFAKGPGKTKRAIDLAKLVRDNSRLLQTILPAGVELLCDCPDKPAMVQANAAELQQALLNLVMNAKDAIEERGEVNIKLTAHDAQAQLVVADTGCGMTDEVLNRALEPFYTTKARLKGTGLGLSQVHGIVTEHDGELTLESTPDRGTTITITLPLILNHSLNQPSPTQTEHAKP